MRGIFVTAHLSTTPKLLVELAGASGVGKTTAAPILARRLREILGMENVAALPEKDLPRRQRRWRHMQRRLWILSHPADVLAAWRASRARPVIARFSVWLDLFSTHGIAWRALGGEVRTALIDQGFLRLSMTPAHAPFLPGHLLPGLVIQLVADPAVLEVRRITRDKVRHKLYEGPQRLANARRSRQLMSTLPEAELRAMLGQFGGKFCNPPLSSEEIGQILRSSAGIPDAPATQGFIRCHPAVLAALQARGVRVVQVDNSRQDGIEPVIEQCLQIILAHSHAPAQGAPS